MEEIKVGITGRRSEEVVFEYTAGGMNSGALPVYATPRMINLMEWTCHTSIEPYLEEGWGSVGTELNVKHLSASPIGCTITCESRLVEIDRKRLVFEVKAYDDAGLIGEGTHERFIVNNEKFMSRLESKLQK